MKIYIFLAVALLSKSLVAVKSVAYIYEDEGVTKHSMNQASAMMKRLTNYEVRSICASDVIAGEWTKDAAAFVMPGGRDVPYAEKLNGQGNENIKDFVSKGGCYIGLCAGAYYGSAEIMFDRGGSLEISGKRELAFFPGVAEGPLLPFSYASRSGARILELKTENQESPNLKSYYNGGCFFKPYECDASTSQPEFDVLARTLDEHGNKPVTVHIPYDEGHVLLSGAHIEYNADTLREGTSVIEQWYLYFISMIWRRPFVDIDTIINDLRESQDNRDRFLRDVFCKMNLEIKN